MQDLIPIVEGEPKPNGYTGIVDQNGQRWWMSLDVLKRKPPTTALSVGQIERIRAFKEILAEHDRTSLSETIENFQRDEHPEPQIRIFEAVAAAYRAELRDRPSAEEAERTLLFRALLQATFGVSDAGDAVAKDPKLADLLELGRALDRFRAEFVARSSESPDRRALRPRPARPNP